MNYPALTRSWQTLLLCCLSAGAAAHRPEVETAPPFSTNEQVGRAAKHRVVTPVNQVLTPLGRTVELPVDTSRPHPKRGAHAAALRRDEVAVLQFLQDELA